MGNSSTCLPVLVVLALGAGCGLIADIQDGQVVSTGTGGSGGATGGAGGATGGAAGSPSGGTGGAGGSTGGAGGSTGGGGGGGATGGAGGANDAYAKAVLEDMPIAYYRLDEAPGATTVADSSGNGHTGAVVGGVVLGAPGAISGHTAASFDGSSSIDLGDNFDFAGTSSFTLEGWIWPLASKGAFFAKSIHTGSYDGWLVGEGTSDFQAFRGTGVVTSSPLDKTKYTHLVVTYDGLTLNLYRNGQLAKSSSTTAPVLNHGASAFIGYGENWSHLVGSVDEVAFYDHALTAARVAAHYAAK